MKLNNIPMTSQRDNIAGASIYQLQHIIQIVNGYGDAESKLKEIECYADASIKSVEQYWLTCVLNRKDR